MAAMKEGLRSALRQRTRLAALGTAVNKISHDLRNMLATATLISDRLAMSQDPEVQRITPTLVRAIDRAAALCSATLNFTRETPPLRLAPRSEERRVGKEGGRQCRRRWSPDP